MGEEYQPLTKLGGDPLSSGKWPTKIEHTTL